MGFLKNKTYIKLFIAIIILIIGITLRIMYMDTSLWYDEACSWFSAKQNFPSGIIHNLLTLDLQHTPIYFFILHFWIKLFGTSEFALRSLSVIFGILSIPLTYIITKKITSSTVQSFFTSAITAVSPLLVLFSVEIRMYPIAVFLVLLSVNFLIDFEKTNSIKSLISLIVTNILIPYTLTGGILYNLSLLIWYSIYLNKKNKNSYHLYIKGAIAEWICLIPYIALILYYAKLRKIFVIAHELNLTFIQIVDNIRNFFGTNLIQNIYWPASESYNITLLFTLLVIVPCVYFIIGLIKSLKTDDNFIKTLTRIFVFNFFLAVLFSYLQVNVFTVRYILYLLIPFYILSVSGLFKYYGKKHSIIFLSLFILFSGLYTYKDFPRFKNIKSLALKTVRLESDKLGLGVDDIIIMPFGSDAPYYFRDLNSPRVFNFDFHKEARNPYNKRFYDDNQQNRMKNVNKYTVVYNSIQNNSVLSQAYVNTFYNEVTSTVPKGRYAVIALYDSDANSVVDIETLRKNLGGVWDLRKDFTIYFLQKYMCDTIALLNRNFVFVNSYKKDNYTFLIFQKQ